MSKASRALDDYQRSLGYDRKETVVVEKSSGGIGFGGALFLVFLVLKLTDVINWSWWWVTAPLWIPFAIVVAIAIIVGIVALVVSKD